MKRLFIHSVVGPNNFLSKKKISLVVVTVQAVHHHINHRNVPSGHYHHCVTMSQPVKEYSSLFISGFSGGEKLEHDFWKTSSLFLFIFFRVDLMDEWADKCWTRSPLPKTDTNRALIFLAGLVIVILLAGHICNPVGAKETSMYFFFAFHSSDIQLSIKAHSVINCISQEQHQNITNH